VEGDRWFNQNIWFALKGVEYSVCLTNNKQFIPFSMWICAV